MAIVTLISYDTDFTATKRNQKFLKVIYERSISPTFYQQLFSPISFVNVSTEYFHIEKAACKMLVKLISRTVLNITLFATKLKVWLVKMSIACFLLIHNFSRSRSASVALVVINRVTCHSHSSKMKKCFKKNLRGIRFSRRAHSIKPIKVQLVK